MHLQNHFLIAVPQIERDYFSSSLIFICEHTDDGAVGFVINQPSDILLNELLNQANLKVNRRLYENRILAGGPVATDQCFSLHSPDFIYASSKKITDSLYLTNGWETLQAISVEKGPNKFEIALGYAGWGPGQLENEIARNIWVTVEASNTILFEANYENRLSLATQEIGLNLDLLSNIPGHA